MVSFALCFYVLFFTFFLFFTCFGINTFSIQFNPVYCTVFSIMTSPGLFLILFWGWMQLQYSMFIFLLAGFNWAASRGRGLDLIGHPAIANIPGQRGGNITMFAAISHQGALHCYANLGHRHSHHIPGHSSSFQLRRRVDQSRPGMLSSGTTWLSTVLLRCATGSPATQN